MVLLCLHQPDVAGVASISGCGIIKRRNHKLLVRQQLLKHL